MHRGEVENLGVRNKSMDFIDLLYKVTKSFPKEELFSLTNQIRSAGCSIAMNIAEGNGKRSDKEFAHYLHISYCSALEVETALRIASRQGYIDSEYLRQLIEFSKEIRRMLLGLKKSLK